MKNIENNFDEKGRQIWIPYTEKDSPHFGKDYNKLWDSQKKEHDRYVRGEVSYMSPEIYLEISEKMNKHMKEVRREYIKKSHASWESAKNIILNA